jgi:hypothetical protein
LAKSIASETSGSASDPAIYVEIYKQCVNSHDIFNTPNIAPVAAHFVPLQPLIFKTKYSETEFRKALYESRIRPMLQEAQVSRLTNALKMFACSYLWFPPFRLPLVVLDVEKMGEEKLKYRA